MRIIEAPLLLYQIFSPAKHTRCFLQSDFMYSALFLPMIWKQPFTLDSLNALNRNTMGETLGIVFTETGDDFIAATMPANHNTVQPYRILHGGASVALAETLGSVASTLCLGDLNTQTAVGLEINANHLKAVPEGSVVTGTCRPVRLGSQIHVWQIEIRDEKGNLSCVSRLTVAIVSRRSS